MNARCERVWGIAQSAPALEEVRRDVANALNAVQGLFTTLNFGQSWASLKESNLKREYLAALRFGGQLIRSEYPLKRITEEELRELIGQISEAIAVAEQDGLAGSAYVASLQGLIKLLERFKFYGHYALAERVALLHTAASAQDVQAKSKSRAKAKHVLGLLFVAFIGQDDFFTAIENAERRVPPLVGGIVQEYIAPKLALPAPLKQLPPPNSGDVEGLLET